MLWQKSVRLAQLDRAFGYGPKGRGFESSNARYYVRLCTLLCAFVQVGLQMAGKSWKTDVPAISLCLVWKS